MFKFIGGAIFGGVIGAAAGATCVGALVLRTEAGQAYVKTFVANKTHMILFGQKR